MKKITIPDECNEIAICGGPYNNFEAVQEFLKVTSQTKPRFCLGDLGGFGPFPDRTLELIKNSDLQCIQGNYDRAVGHGEPECGCGYSDPKDQHFAQVSFDYTLKNTSEKFRPWLRELPALMELSWRGKKILLCHGSPDEMNEFVWESETSNAQIQNWLDTYKVDGICATHSGLPWVRKLPSKGFWMNVGVLGRPAHEGRTNVYYATLSLYGGVLTPKLRELPYNSEAVISAMREQQLPEEFCEALQKGIWTTCYNIMPESERAVRRRS